MTTTAPGTTLSTTPRLTAVEDRSILWFKPPSLDDVTSAAFNCDADGLLADVMSMHRDGEPS